MGQEEKLESPRTDRGQMPAWQVDELPEPPPVKFRNIRRMVGPGAILLAASIGGGEWLAGPAAVVQYGPSILGVVTIAIVLQVILNLEAIRYTLYTGEPIYGGFLRLWPGPRLWAPVYALLAFVQLAWPALAASAAVTLIAGFIGRLPTEANETTMHWLGTILMLLVVAILSLGGTIERMLEFVSIIMVGMVILFLLVVNIFFIPWEGWVRTFVGFFQLSGFQGNLNWPLMGTLAATAACGGVGNLTITNWMRDKGYGMGARTGAIPSAIAGRKVEFSHSGKIFEVTPMSLSHWKTWWRYVHIDQIWLWGVGAFVGMFLNVNLAGAVIPQGTELKGMGIGVYQAQFLADKIWPGFWILTLVNGFWIVFSTQLGNTDILVRSVTDVLWMGSKRVRDWSKGRVQAVYYTILMVYTFLALFAIRIGNPLDQFKIVANVAGFVLVISGIQIFLVNRKYLPRPLQGSWWRQVGLLSCALFYALFFIRVMFSIIFK